MDWMGQTLKGRYVIEEFVAQGGMGMVFRAKDTALGRDVAIKILHPFLQHEQQFARRFIQEAQTIARFQNPHIIQIFDVSNENEESLYFVAEYLPNGTLKEILQNKTLTQQETVQLLEQVAYGLKYIHDKGHVHRDVKPSNIFIDEDGNAKIGDFGIVKDHTTDITKTDSQFGTPEYIAPEQIESSRDVDEKADIYSFAIIAYEMLTNKVPFSGSTAVILRGHLIDSIPSLSQHNTSLPLSIETIFQKALAKKAEHRYSSAPQFISDLKDSLAGTRDITQPFNYQKSRNNRRTLKRWTIGVGMVVLFCCFGVLSLTMIANLVLSSSETVNITSSIDNLDSVISDDIPASTIIVTSTNTVVTTSTDIVIAVPTDTPFDFWDDEILTLVEKAAIEQFIESANIAEANSLYHLDIAYAEQSFSGNQFNILQDGINQLQEDGVYRINKYYTQESYTYEMNVIGGSIIQVIRCEYWSTEFYVQDTNLLVWENDFHVAPQMINIELIDEQLSVTSVLFYEQNSKLCEQKTFPSTLPVSPLTPQEKAKKAMADLETVLLSLKEQDEEISDVVITPAFEWLVVRDLNGYWPSDHFPEKVIAFLIAINTEGQEIRDVVFTPTNEWLILFDINQVEYSKGYPEMLVETVDLNIIENEDVALEVAFFGLEGWAIVTEKTLWYWSLSEDVIENVSNIQNVTHLAFTPSLDPEWIVLTAEDEIHFSENIPADIRSELVDLQEDSHTIKQVIFFTEEDWLILYNKNDFVTNIQ